MHYVINRSQYNPRYKQRRKMKSMLRRGGHVCPYCELPMLTDHGLNHKRAPSRDHMIPLSRGGPDTLENLLTCCRGCNEDKGSLTAEEYIAVRAGMASRIDHRLDAWRARMLRRAEQIPEVSAVLKMIPGRASRSHSGGQP